MGVDPASEGEPVLRNIIAPHTFNGLIHEREEAMIACVLEENVVSLCFPLPVGPTQPSTLSVCFFRLMQYMIAQSDLLSRGRLPSEDSSTRPARWPMAHWLSCVQAGRGFFRPVTVNGAEYPRVAMNRSPRPEQVGSRESVWPSAE